MAHEGLGRLPVVETGKLVGIVTRSDLINAHKPRLRGEKRAERLRGKRLSFH